MRNKFLGFLVILCIGITACDSNRVFDEYQSVPNQWHKDSIIDFYITPPDSLKAYDLFVNIRNTSEYKYSNLFLIVEMNFPNGKKVIDTLEYNMAKPTGEFLGSGFSDIKESKLWYKEGVVFSESGNYLVRIQHAMRENGKIQGVENLEGIIDIGFRIETPPSIY